MVFRYVIEHDQSRMILRVNSARPENGTEVVLSSNLSGSAALWEVRDGMLHSVMRNGLVLQVNEEKDKLQLWGVNGSYNQKWTFCQNSTIVNGTGKAIDIKEGQIKEGAPIIPWDSHGRENQRFRLVVVWF